MRTRRYMPLLFALLLLALAGCGGGGGSGSGSGANWDELVWNQDNWA